MNNQEAGLDLQMMCRRGCQPGNNDLLPLLPPTLEALNIAIQEPSTRARGVRPVDLINKHRGYRQKRAGPRGKGFLAGRPALEVPGWLCKRLATTQPLAR